MKALLPHRFSRIFRFSRFAVLALAVFACACGKQAAAPASSVPAETLLSDESARLAATLSTNTIRIGDPIELTLTALHRPGTRVEFPVPEIAHGKDIIVRSAEAPETLPANGDLERTIRRVQLTSLVVSNHVVAENAPVLVHLPDGTVSTQSMPFVSFEVATSLVPGETAPRPLDLDLARWPVPRSHWLLWAAAALLFLLLLAVAAWQWVRRPSVVVARKAPPPPPPHVTALAALAALRAEDWTGADRAEPFFVRLSAIVRAYVEGRFGIRAPERTTEEFIRDAARSRELAPAQRRSLGDFLETSDLVKFARHRPAAPELLSALDSAETFVRETIPAPKPAPGADDAPSSCAPPSTAPSGAKGVAP